MRNNGEQYEATSYRWVILVSVALLYGAFGLAMRSIAPLVTPMLNDLDMSYAEMGIILGSWQLVYIPVSIMAGIAMDRWGVRRTLFVGTIIVALSEGLRYFVTGFANLLPVVALFGLGGPLISVGAPKTTSLWFRGRDRSTAVSIYTAAPWLGGLFALAATNSLVMPATGYSWRLTFVIYSLVAVAFAFIWLIFARDSKPDGGVASAGPKETLLRLMGVRNVLIVLFAGLITLLMDHGFSHWLPRMLEEKGLSPEAAGFTASVPLIVALPSVLLVPRLTPQHRRGRVVAIIGVLAAAALITTHFSSGLLLQAGLALYGAATPSLVPLLMLLLMDDPHIGPEYMGLAGGIFFAVAEIGGFSGPLLMGVLVDATGGFLAGMVVLASAGLLMTLATFLMRKTEPAA